MEPKKRTVEELLKNLKNNRDAVVIVGDKVVEELNMYPIDEKSKKMLNRKKMVKEPKYFWKHYKENVHKDYGVSEAEKQINDLLDLGVVKTVINLNYTGSILPTIGTNTQLIELKGHKNKYRCMSCGATGTFTEDMLNTLNVLKCEHCKGKIAPSIVMFEEKYLEKNTKAIKDAIFIEEDGEVKLNTHCLIFIGVDFEEDYLHEIIESYDAIKAKVQNDENPYFTVLIAHGDLASIEYYQPEFATNENIEESIKRLIANLKEA